MKNELADQNMKLYRCYDDNVDAVSDIDGGTNPDPTLDLSINEVYELWDALE